MELWIERGIFVWPCIGFCSLALLNPHGASAVPKGQWWLSNMWWITVMHRGFDFEAWMFICTIFATDQIQSPHSQTKTSILLENKKPKLCVHVWRKLLTCVWLRFVLLYINDVYKMDSICAGPFWCAAQDGCVDLIPFLRCLFFKSVFMHISDK